MFQELKRKKLTQDGRNRKERIVDKVFYERNQSKMIMGLYSTVLPLLKEFVLLFEMKEPLIHQLHEEQVILGICHSNNCYFVFKNIPKAYFNTHHMVSKVDKNIHDTNC